MGFADNKTLVFNGSAHETPTTPRERVSQRDRWQVNDFATNGFAAEHVILSLAFNIPQSHHHVRGSKRVQISDEDETEKEWDEKGSGEHRVFHDCPPFRGSAVVDVFGFIHGEKSVAPGGGL